MCLVVTAGGPWATGTQCTEVRDPAKSPGMQGTDPLDEELFIQSASIAEVEQSCSRERTGCTGVKEPPENVHKICVDTDFRKSLSFYETLQEQGQLRSLP